jgi:hypothetical protein
MSRSLCGMGVRWSCRDGRRITRPSIRSGGRVTEMLADELAVAQGGPITWRGQLVHSVAEIMAGTGVMHIRFLRASPSRRQALSLRSIAGTMTVAGHTENRLILWSDTAPSEVLVRLDPTPPDGPMTLRCWNSWESGGVTHAWIGNAGMVVERDEGVVTLRCSDGHDEVSFDDLVVTIDLSTPPTTAP